MCEPLCGDHLDSVAPRAHVQRLDAVRGRDSSGYLGEPVSVSPGKDVPGFPRTLICVMSVCACVRSFTRMWTSHVSEGVSRLCVGGCVSQPGSPAGMC